ncbi:hypothetical protein N7462_000875 [Penicillium macrosclerotiorum]|uniref:uncharacterized protein n=1 Tax=Penicillium macrosclerotiorum TaxID=303699 RepID=UPI0025485FD5|nr:uncharacterized protein N7462_000875 [Penicillium macrosclerotiorum]KAJ5698870.1 hypothetical protein N7462_000875 [Penicillium macrosclerotiorum]
MPGKRIVVCLDGTWVNSDEGYNRPSLSDPNFTLQVPSNVTRLYRALQKKGLDGKGQVIYYHSGVGTSGTLSDTIAGGVFGAGVGENIREAYSFIATNYEPGDEIILVGFSRGAFTARSVAGLIIEIGLLTSRGMEYLYPIFKDIQNIQDPEYKDKFPGVPFHDKPFDARGYRRRLEEESLTRLYDPDGYRIRVRCVAVWETVFPTPIYPTSSRYLAPLKNKYQISLRTSKNTDSSCTWRFYDTSLSNGIEHAFQALALDENRTSFAPAVWERPRNVRTDLRQVWFCGAHSNVGGGLPDQELANISMAWMMDQLASIGVAFEDDTIDRLFAESVVYFYDHAADPATPDSSRHRRWTEWALPSIYEEHEPVRPWGLGEIVQPDTGFYRLAGKTTRTPGLYRRVDPDTGLPTEDFLRSTNERVHRSVRVRLALEGLSYDDKGLYKCRALLKKGPWEIKRLRVVSRHETRDRDAYGDEEAVIERSQDYRWGWVYAGPVEDTPPETVLMEESLGPYEKRLLHLNKG